MSSLAFQLSYKCFNFCLKHDTLKASLSDKKLHKFDKPIVTSVDPIMIRQVDTELVMAAL